MSGIRVGATQPAPTRAAVILTETTSLGLGKLQDWLGRWFERAIALAEPVLWQQLPNVLVALLTPAAGVALVLGLWRLCADLGWAGEFLITGGLFSHWQVWIALSIALKLLSSTLLAWAGKNREIPAED